ASPACPSCPPSSGSEQPPSCIPSASWLRRAARQRSVSRLRLPCGQLPQHDELSLEVRCYRDRFQLGSVSCVFDRQQRQEFGTRSEEHTSELQSRRDLVCRLLLEKKKNSVA